MPGLFIELDLTGCTALVVGLGPVGQRKACSLLEAGAHVIGIDPRSSADLMLESELRQPAQNGRFVHQPQVYHPDQLREARLAIAAATPDVNRQVVADSRTRGIWVVSASEPDAGSARLPAVWRRGGLTLGVSTGGASPALAAALRDRAAAALGDEEAGLVEVFAGLRPLVAARLADQPERRRDLLRDWADPRWLERFRQGGGDAVRRAVLAALDDRADSDPTCEK